MVFVTCPLILGISFLIGWFLASKLHIAVGVVMAVLVILTMAALFMTGCVDPGMLVRQKERPAMGGDNWYFSDIAKTFRPPRAAYCHMCRVVFKVEWQKRKERTRKTRQVLIGAQNIFLGY